MLQAIPQAQYVAATGRLLSPHRTWTSAVHVLQGEGKGLGRVKGCGKGTRAGKTPRTRRWAKCSNVEEDKKKVEGQVTRVKKADTTAEVRYREKNIGGIHTISRYQPPNIGLWIRYLDVSNLATSHGMGI